MNQLLNKPISANITVLGRSGHYLLYSLFLILVCHYVHNTVFIGESSPFWFMTILILIQNDDKMINDKWQKQRFVLRRQKVGSDFPEAQHWSIRITQVRGHPLCEPPNDSFDGNNQMNISDTSVLGDWYFAVHFLNDSLETILLMAKNNMMLTWIFQ